MRRDSEMVFRTFDSGGQSKMATGLASDFIAVAAAEVG
jgi:hypothetical protein